MDVSTVTIHPTAAIEEGAVLGAGTEVGAHAVVGAGVELGENCWVGPHAVLTGRIRGGDRNQFFPFSCVGALSQDLWEPEIEGYVYLGDDNVVRENVTINAGTTKEYRCTSLGNGNNVMAGCHIAHDCVIGDNVVLANHVLLGGHVRVRSHANVGGAAAVHHFVTIGEHAFVGGLSRVIHDVPPWMLLEGNPARLKSVNLVGARRSGLSDEEVQALRETYRRLFHGEGGNRREERQRMEGEDPPAPVRQVLESLSLQASGHQGRHLERYRTDDRRLDLDAVPAVDRPRFIPG